MEQPQPPKGIVPHLVCNGAANAIEYYKKAFGAEEVMRMPAEDGKRLMHAQIRIGDAAVYLCDDFPEMCGGKSRLPTGTLPVVLHMNVRDCDAAIKRCADAGAKVTMPGQDMFWGDRYGQVQDPFGYTWAFAAPVKK